MKQGMRRGLLGLLGVIITLIVILVFFPWNWLRGPIQTAVGKATGRELKINGDLIVHVRLTPRIEVNQVTFSNASWGSTPQMLTADKIDFRVRLLPLLWGSIEIPEVGLSHPHIVLERKTKDQRNWVFKQKQETGEKSAVWLGVLRVDQGELIYKDAPLDIDLKANVATDAQQTHFNVDGTYKHQHTLISGTAGPVLAIQDTSSPFPIKAAIEVGSSHASFDGHITGLTELQKLEAKLELRGQSLAKLNPLLPVTLPDTPPYRLKGNLAHQAKWWSFKQFEGKVGDSDLNGDFEVDLAGKRPQIRTQAVSRNLDLDDLAGFFGGQPKTGPGETASQQQRAEAAKKAASGRLLPDKPISFNALHKADVDFRFSGAHIRGTKLPLDKVQAHLKLDDGRLVVDPLNFEVADGNVGSTIVLNANDKPPSMALESRIHKIRLKRLIPNLPATMDSEGLMGGSIKLKGSGTSVADILGKSNGTLGVSVAGGRVSNLLLEVAGLDGGEIIKFLLGGDKTVPLRCAVLSFDVKDGLMKSDTLLVDTTDTLIKGDGTIDLNTEKLTLNFRPLPKDASILSLRTPINIGGTLGSPTIRPELGKLAARGAGAVVLGALLTPAASLLALVENGPGKDSDCGRLITQAQNKGEGPTQPTHPPVKAPTNKGP